MSSSEKSSGSEKLLAADHNELDQLLRALLTALDEADVAAAFARLDLFWARLAMHIRAEHLHLFPEIIKEVNQQAGRSAEATARLTGVPEAIAQLHKDHDFFMHQLAISIKTTRASLTAVDRRSAVNDLAEVRKMMTTLSTRLEAHNKLEEELVYRLATELLEPSQQSRLEAGIRKELENLPPRFNTDD